VWRRSRPFWAGILLLVSGAELLLIPLPEHSMGLLLHVGTGGVAGILIGALLIVCALLLWFSPAQRTFYAIVAILLAIGALIASNLGGFVIGTLLGVLGGSLGFAWTPVDPAAAPARGRRRRPRWPLPPGAPGKPSAGLDLIRGPRPGNSGRTGPSEPGAAEAGGNKASSDEVSAGAVRASDVQSDELRSDEVAGGEAGESGHGVSYRGLLVLPLAAGLIFAAGHPAPPGSAAGPARSSPVPAAVVTSARLTDAPGAPAAPDPLPTCLPLPLPLPCGSPSPSPSPAPSTSPAPGQSPAPPVIGPTTGPGRGRPGGPGRGGRTRHVKKATVSGAVEVAAVPSVITARSATLTGLSFDGVATVPTAAGPVKMLKFSMSGLSLAGDDDLMVTEGGFALAIRADTLNFTGDVTLLTTKFSGDLLGVPLTFTPSSPPPAVLPKMTFTHVVTERPYTSADALVIGGLLITTS